MNKNRKMNIIIGVLYSMITIMLLLVGFVYVVSLIGAVISAFVAYTAFRGDNVIVKYAKLKEGFIIRKHAKNGNHN